MPWECGQCHFDANRDEDRQCQACMRRRMPKGVVLVDVASGREQRTNLPTPVGRRLLRKIAEEAHFASDPQFDLIRDDAAGAWLLRHSASATNPTYYDGRPVGTDPHPIEDGGAISVGPERLRMTVRFQF